MDTNDDNTNDDWHRYFEKAAQEFVSSLPNNIKNKMDYSADVVTDC